MLQERGFHHGNVLPNKPVAERRAKPHEVLSAPVVELSPRQLVAEAEEALLSPAPDGVSRNLLYELGGERAAEQPVDVRKVAPPAHSRGDVGLLAQHAAVPPVSDDGLLAACAEKPRRHFFIGVSYKSMRWRAINTALACLHTSLLVVTLLVAEPVALTVFELQLVPSDNCSLSGRGYTLAALPSKVRFVYKLGIASFFLLSAVFHYGNAWLWHTWYLDNLARCRAPARWAEYFLSASVMSVCLAFPAGMMSLVELWLVFALTATTMLFGDLTERLNRPKQGVDEWEEPSAWARLRPHLYGYVPQCAARAAILFTFFRGTVGYASEQRPPDFVAAIVFSQLVLFFSFGFVQLAVLLSPPSRYAYGELAYQALSLVSKGALGITLLGNQAFLERIDCIFQETC